VIFFIIGFKMYPVVSEGSIFNAIQSQKRQMELSEHLKIPQLVAKDTFKK
jgi:hypothetical protein